jgi:outer membrane protein assembly factor BamD
MVAPKNKIFNHLILLLMSLIFINCAGDRPKGKTEAEILFKEAQELISEERYLLATEKLNQIKNQYPYSYYAKPAELLHADVLFMQENYVESAAAYMLYRDFHPKDDRIEYVIFRIAESYYMQIPPTNDRDLQGAAEAVRYYQELLEKFPKTSYAKLTREKIRLCQKMLLEKDLYIADFYYRTEVFQASRYWYREILSKNKDKNLTEQLVFRLIDSAMKAKLFKECIADGKYLLKKYAGIMTEEVQELKQECHELLKEKIALKNKSKRS